MSQMLTHAADKKNILLHELFFVKKRTPIKSTVVAAICTICDRGLDDGVSVTATKIGQKMKFFCQYHLPMNI